MSIVSVFLWTEEAVLDATPYYLGDAFVSGNTVQSDTDKLLGAGSYWYQKYWGYVFTFNKGTTAYPHLGLDFGAEYTVTKVIYLGATGWVNQFTLGTERFPDDYDFSDSPEWTIYR